MDVQGSQYHLLYGQRRLGPLPRDGGDRPDAGDGPGTRTSADGVPSAAHHGAWSTTPARACSGCAATPRCSGGPGAATPHRPGRPPGRRARRLRQLVLDRRRPAHHPLAAGRRPDRSTCGGRWTTLTGRAPASAGQPRRVRDLRGPAVPAAHALPASPSPPGTTCVAGYRRARPSEPDLLLFDLQAGGAPLRLLWPPQRASAAGPGRHARRGRARARPRAQPPTGASTSTSGYAARQTRRPRPFAPAAAGRPSGPLGPAAPVATAARPPAAPPAPDLHPISIEPGPDGSALILDSDPARGYSLVHLLRRRRCCAGPASLADAVEVIDPADPTDTPAAVLAARLRLRLPGRPAGDRAARPADALRRRRRGQAGGRVHRRPGRAGELGAPSPTSCRCAAGTARPWCAAGAGRLVRLRRPLDPARGLHRVPVPARRR